jgi:hypothetical protein
MGNMGLRMLPWPLVPCETFSIGMQQNMVIRREGMVGVIMGGCRSRGGSLPNFQGLACPLVRFFTEDVGQDKGEEWRDS